MVWLIVCFIAAATGGAATIQAGQFYTQRVIAKALAHLNNESAVAVAEARYGKSNPLLVAVMKADVAGGGSGSGEWGAELVSAV